MSLTPAAVDALAAHVERAQLDATAIAKLTNDHPDMDLADAYRVQDALRARYIARGDRVVGFKCGLTSKAKMVHAKTKTAEPLMAGSKLLSKSSLPSIPSTYPTAP